ncbi:MAG: T9SS type A sorting domain-containing protein [Ignavibacteria bacterium]|nr:T9SS type A sorting domain-containing protein [Ignavibacteria bacterium]
MKLIIIIVLLTVYSNNAFSQSGRIQQNSGITSKINAVYFENSQTGWSVGDSGRIIKTTNGGTNWYLINSGTFKNLNSLSFNSSNNAFIVGDSGIVLRSTDGGDIWNYFNIPRDNFNFTSVFFVNNDIGFIGGIPYSREMNKIFKTSDVGNTWDSILTNPGFVSVKTIYFTNTNDGWIIQGYGILGEQVLFKTTDGGFNWNIQFTNNILYSVYFIDPLTGWTSGEGTGFNVYKSTNGGSNWNPCLFCGLSPVHSFFFTDSLKGWGASEGGIINTTNAGTNWIVQNSTHPLVTYNSIHFTDSLTGWVVGDSGTILKTTTGGVLTNFTNTSTEIPGNYFLSQNYPNPFNPVTNLEFGISKLGFVSLKVYDVLGSEIKTLVNENNPAGNYEVEFDGSHLSSGIYFYKIETTEFTDVKKMMIIK